MQFEKWQSFKNFYNKATSEKYSCIHFSIHFDGIDINVKNWEINTLRDKVKLKPHKALEKPKPKPKIDKQKFTGASISSILFNKKRRK